MKIIHPYYTDYAFSVLLHTNGATSDLSCGPLLGAAKPVVTWGLKEAGSRVRPAEGGAQSNQGQKEMITNKGKLVLACPAPPVWGAWRPGASKGPERPRITVLGEDFFSGDAWAPMGPQKKAKGETAGANLKKMYTYIHNK